MKSKSIFDVPEGRTLALALLGERTDRTGECWLWTHSKTAGGYGKFKLKGLYLYAHRTSYEIHVGPIPDGLCILHSCDTPACVNPAHLRAGTHQENAQDRDSRKRGRSGRTHCPHGHPYDEANTIRRRNGGRACRTCHNADMRRRYHAKAAALKAGAAA